MKSLTLCVLVTTLGVSLATYPLWTEPYPYLTYEKPCNNIITDEITINFQQGLYEAITIFFKKLVTLSDAQFVFSPYTIWKTLAAIAEGSEGQTRYELFNLLRLPEDRCTRQVYYQLAASRELSNDVVLDRKHVFIADSSVIFNRNWENLVKTHQLLNVIQTPYKSNPAPEIEYWKRVFNAHLPNINLHGNSLILESLDYQGLWSSAFSEVAVEPFYNALGEPIANVEFMKMKKRVSVAYLPTLNMKLLELPVGQDGRYKMLIGLVMGISRTHAYKNTLDVIHSSAIFEAVSNFKRSQVPIEVAIPRVAITSEVDIRRLLEELGINGLWVDPYATRNISEPAALPSSYIQRVTVTLENQGVRPTIQEYANFIPPLHCDTTAYSSNRTGLDPAVGHDFIANRPFLFGLFDSETYTCLFASSFSNPN